MSDDSGDLSDIVDPRPSGSKCRTRSDHNQKKNRRIVMRIEFDDSDEETTSASCSSGGEEDEEQPSCSTKTNNNNRRRSGRFANAVNADDTHDDSDQFNRNASSIKRRQNRRPNVLALDGSSSSDGTSSGSEIMERVKMRGKTSKKVLFSEDERDVQSPPKQSQTQIVKQDDNGFSSDSSSNELLEKCPICLLTFRKQEIGSPATCNHIFCANCIEAWSKNVQTCPIDRIEFEKIIVRESFENRKIVREICVDKNKAGKELEVDDDIIIVEEDVTNCEICNSPEREDVMLLCDSCNQGYHIDCLTPPLDEIPEGSWYCDNCFDSQDEDEDDEIEEDLSMLYEDIRDMGIPESRLRVTEVHQPRILRTRQNERIRADILRRMRTRNSAALTTTTTTTTTTTSRGVGRPRKNPNATTTTTTTRRTATTATTKRKPQRRRRRRRARQRTYVVEYDLNNFDEKFAIKTTKKVIRRRKRKRRTVRRSRTCNSVGNDGRRLTASQRLAEQMGVKREQSFVNQSHLAGANSGLSLFGNANDLEYFSDSDQDAGGGGGLESEIHIETGHGTAVQTSVRISNFGSHRSQKSLLFGRLNRSTAAIAAANIPTNSGTPDILSNILDMQDRWHTASRNLENVHINADGTLNLNKTEKKSENNTPTTAETQQQTVNPSDVTQAPMYPQGGRNQNFNNSSGGYNSNNQQNYRSGGGGGGSGGGNQYRHSTGGSGTGVTPNFNMVGRGNFSFSNPDYNSNQNQSMNFSSFNDRERDRDRDRDRDRFNQRNRQQQNNNSSNNNNNNMNQRHSLPFNNIQQQQSLQQPPPLQPPPLQLPHLQQLPLLHPPPQLLLSGPPHLQSQQPTVPPPPQLPLLNSSMDNQLFGGLPPPLHLQQQQQQNEPQLFSGLPPPPIFEPHLTIGPQLPQPQHLPDLSIPPPMVMTVQSHIVPPPPPAPPAALASWNSTLLSYAQDDDDDDSNCPNFSVYSAESQEVAKASETKTATNDGQKPKEDDENEDLVQLDDDDDIPIPADNSNTSQHQNSDLYEPENPTEEPENESETEIEPEQIKTSDSSMGIIGPKNKPAEKVIDTEIENEKEGNNEYDPEHETDTIPSNDDDEIELNENNKNETNEKVDTTDKNCAKKKNDKDEIDKSDKVTVNRENQEKTTTSDIAKKSEDARSLSPTLSDAKIPDAANRKGVLELYDDSDWDELDIDRPKSRERIEGEKLSNENKTEEADKVAEEDTNVANEKEEADRSYTPCLDEKNDLEEGALPSDEENDGATANDEGNTPVIEPTTSDLNNVEKSADKIEKNDVNKEVGIGGLETELISDDEENDRRINNRRRNDKRNKREAETFKKVSHKRKERNYRVEKVGKRYNRRRSSMSRSKSRSRSLTRSPTRSRSKSPKSRRNRKRKSRTPHRSRSRSNDKENVNGGRFRFGFFNNRRFQRPLRPKRRELPRYDVRNVVGQQRNFKDRYGRDTSRPPRYSRSVSPARRRKSLSRSRSRSLSPKRNRRNSFSMSPSPPGVFNRRSPPRRSPSPRLRRSHSPQRRLPSPTRLRSRSLSPIHRMNGRKVIRRIRNVASPVLPRSGSMTPSPRYTPRLSRSPSPSLSPKLRKKGKKKPIKDRKKKKINRKRVASKSPEPMRRLSRQRDPYIDDLMLAPPKRKRHRSPQQAKAVQSPHMEEPTWSPSPSPPPIREYDNNNVSWTPPLVSPTGEFAEMHFPNERPTGSKAAAKKDKRKREKKKKTKIEKRRDGIRKEKRRQRRTETPEPLPSKEVFASGNNILVSVSFNKEAATQPQQQTTVVTLPPTREEVVSSLRRASADRQVSTGNVAKKKKEKSHKRKKLDAKPVAIIDLERSPFQVHQEPADVIVLTDSEGGQDDDVSERREHRDNLMSDSGAENLVHHHRTQVANVTSGGRSGSHQEKTPPLLETIMEESYEIQQTGPKTPPEPPTTIKFTLLAKKQNKQRNPLHEEPELNGIEDMEDEQDQQHLHRQEMESAMHMQNNQKIGPNTPPESGPCSPDVYDPFDPTKSPSMSPRSPTPPPLIDGGGSQNTMGDKVAEAQAQKHISDEPRLSGERIGQQQTAVGSLGGGGTQGTSTLNPVELVMALMNSKQQNNSQDISNKSIESQYSTSSSHMHTVSSAGAGHDESHGVSGMHDKSDEGISTGGGVGITVLSNVLISTAKSQHIPTISSPTPIPKGSQNLISKLPLPKIVSGSVGSGSGIGIPSGNSNLRNGGGGADDSFNDLESPYSPGSADYEDLFEPPPDTHNSKRRSRRGGNKIEQFDNLFGSSSPVGQMRLPSYTPSNKKRKMAAAGRKSKLVKVAKSGDDHIKVYDDVPNSAVELQVKDKFIAKLNRQERVVEEVKHILKPRFNKKQITKDDYKEIMRRAVPKICHSRSGEINPNKIKNLIEAYVKKFRAKHKKLNIINTGQVSSAVKCAAYLKKLKE